MRIVQYIDSLDDPRVAPYRNLKDRDLAQQGDRFIAEGEQVVRRLLASDFPVESVLLARRREAEIAPIVLPDSIPVYVAADAMMEHVLGFRFHSGVIACGRRKPAAILDDVISQLGRRAMIVVCPDINNTENLGALMRIAAGFGADAFVLGPQCCDPFYRQSLRVSMGAAFQLRLVRMQDLIGDLERLKSEWHFELAAAVLDESAETLREARRGDRLALLFGNESQGLAREVIAACDRRITIPMKLGTDSLNVAIAAAVFMHHFAD